MYACVCGESETDRALPLNKKLCAVCGVQVEEFMLWDLERVAGVISGSQEYKPNCCLVIIDFLVRHGYITPEEPGYLDLVRSLRVGDAL